MFVSKIKGVLAVALVVGLALGGIGVGVGLSTTPVAVAQEKTPKQPPAKEDQLPDSDVRKLLGAPDSQLRLRAALTLAARQDEEAIGVLIDLLADLPAAQSRLAEQTLQELAEEWSPTP